MGTGGAVTAQRGCKIFSKEEVAPAAAGHARPTRVIVSRRVWKPEATERTEVRKRNIQSEAYQTSKWQSPVRGRSRYATRFQGVREIGDSLKRHGVYRSTPTRHRRTQKK